MIGQGAPAPPASPPETPRPTRWVIIGIVLALVAIGGGVGVYLVTRDEPSQPPRLEPIEPSVQPTIEPSVVPTDPASPSPSPEPGPQAFASPQEAIAQELSPRGIDFVGDCTFADIDSDVGAYCSILWGEDSAGRTYIVGPTFSEGEAWFLVARTDSGWAVVRTEPVGAQDSGPPWPTTPVEYVTADMALTAFMFDSGANYIGDCASAGPATPPDAVCSTLWGKGRGGRSYLIGPPFSEPDMWLALARDENGWFVSATAPFGGEDYPPWG